MNKRLSRSFYTRPTLLVAKDLLGKFLIKKDGQKKLIGKIVEVEAYKGPKDKAAHSYGGKITDRSKTFYLEGGHLYIYLCYGINWMLNIVTEKENKPEAILVRALEPIEGCNLKKIENLSNGPGKLCRWLKIDKSFNETDLVNSDKIWLEDRGEVIKKSQIVSAKRIGVDYAGEWAERLWRFYIKNNSFVSRK